MKAAYRRYSPCLQGAHGSAELSTSLAVAQFDRALAKSKLPPARKFDKRELNPTTDVTSLSIRVRPFLIRATSKHYSRFIITSNIRNIITTTAAFSFITKKSEVSQAIGRDSAGG